jgi:hypothetical protein
MSIPISSVPRGTALSRYVAALILSKNPKAAADYSERWRDTPAVRLTFAKAVTAQDTDDGLAEYGIGQELFEFYRAASLVARFSEFMRPTPLRVKVPIELNSGAVSAWVSQSGWKPLRALSFDRVVLDQFKTATVVVISQELARFSKPSAEATIRQILVNGVSTFIDSHFLSDAAAVADESPAGILYGQEAHGSTGSTEAQIRADLAAMGALLETWRYPVWVCKPKSFMFLASLGIIDFLPGGPLLCGFPIMHTTASPQQLALIDAGTILLADDGKSDISIAEHATITMDDGASPASTQEVGLWQTNQVAVRVERFINWAPGTADVMAVKMAVSY